MALQVSGTCRTSDPTLTAGQTYNLKLDTLGNLKVSIADTTTPALIASEAHVGQVTPAYTLLDVTPTMDTVAYASGDVLFTSTVCTSLLRVNDGLGLLKSIQVIDKDDQGVAFDLYFFSSNVTMGTINVAPTISDADLATCLGYVSIASGDYKDLGGARIATKNALDIILKAASGTKNIYMAAVNGSGTPTFTASGLVIRLGVIQS